MSDETTPSPTPDALDLVQAVWQLRTLVCGLGAALLILSLSFNVYIWKQNRIITGATRSRQQQMQQLDARMQELARVANELASYSATRPELVAIFTRYGLELKPSTPPSPAAQP